MKIILKSLALVLVVCFATNSFAQKTKYKYDKDTEMVTKNGTDYLPVVKKGCGFGPECKLSIYDKNGKKVMVVTVESFEDPTTASKSNPQGTVRYATYHFITLDKKAEYANSPAKPDKLVKLIDSNELMLDGLLNESAVNEFVSINGMKFTAQRESIIKVINR